MTREPRADVRDRRAFSLVEVLVVLAIIALLAALLVPVIGKVRAVARATGCRHNLRQVGIAMHLYHQAHRRFPDTDERRSYMTLAGKRGSDPVGHGGAYITPPADRPLNLYLGVPLHPDTEAEIVHCPSDDYMYDRTGSSYGYPNVNHYLHHPNGRGVALHEVRHPSRVLMSYEINAALLAMHGWGLDECAFWHGYFDQFNVVHVDGHVRLVTIEPGRRITGGYTFYWNRYAD